MIKLRLPPLLQQQQQQQQRLLVVLQVLLLLSLCGCVGASETHHDKDHIPTRFEYKYSFKQPFYFPNNTEIVPYFEAGHGEDLRDR